MVKQLSEAYVKTMASVLKKQKLRKIIEMREMVSQADKEGRDITKELHLYGNKVKTHLEIV